MAAPAIGVRPGFAPSSAAVDWTHPLAQGLEFCVVPAVTIHDIAKGYRGVRNGSPTRSTSTFGPAVRLASATSDYLEYSGVPDAPFLGAMSMLWVGNVQTGSAYRSFVHKHASSGAYQSPFSFFTDNSASPMKLTTSRAAVSGPFSNRNFDTNSGHLIVGVDNVVIMMFHSATVTDAPSIFVNGVGPLAATGAGVGTGTVAGSGAPIRIGRRADNAAQANGDVVIVALWSRALSAGEVVKLTADPFCFLRY